ncbi:synaptobrevin [Amylocarpus encephaloides]|uniref:Synaptobrevin n=1 Tax=Amylocarpus encephaloides TaxID=45428 RepID=A0A9P7Y7I5_9HELO|nr:synaptobrevin [Amylocarpus encephaloides]
MARSSTSSGAGAGAHDHTYLNFTRMVSRLQQMILNPDEETERRLRASELEREKVETNLNHARQLLVILEQDAQGIRALSKKQERQTELVRRRDLLSRLQERLQDLRDAGYTDEDDSSEGEDLIGDDTPSEDTSSQAKPSPTNSPFIYEPPIPKHPPSFQPPEPTYSLRARNHTTDRDDLFSTADAALSTGVSPRSTVAPSKKDSLLTHNRTEQEALTTSMLAMAARLKASSNAFAATLDDEKDVLDGTSRGMEKNEEGLANASKKMGTLRTMSEGRGWWGRMLLYAWIAGLMVAAVLVVFVMPKLRFR